MEAQIHPESPREAPPVPPQPLTLQEVRTGVVDRDSVLLQYFLGMTRSYVWAVRNDRVTVHALPPRAEIERRVRPLWEALRDPAAAKNPSAAAVERARLSLDVSRMLLGPVANDLDRARLLVLTDGILRLLPFGALPKPGTGPDARVPLVVEHEVVNLPSASALASVRDRSSLQRRWRKSVVVFADPVFDADDPRIAAPATRAPRIPPAAGAASVPCALRGVSAFTAAGIPRLEASHREAVAIQALTAGADLRLGFDANRRAAASPDLADYRIVHFATHGVINDCHPELSGVVLSLYDRDGTAQEGYLRLQDIYDLFLPVDLVVLSACNTALGSHVLGAGLIGLVRGFMYAGCRRVVASLWKVDDEATQALMTRFYQGLFGLGLTPAAALRAAQVDLLTSGPWTHPSYWAAFVLHGAWN